MIYPNFRHFLSIDLFVFKSTDSKLFFFVQRLLDRWVFHPEFGKCIARKIEMFANIAYGLPLIKHRNNDLSILDHVRSSWYSYCGAVPKPFPPHAVVPTLRVYA